MLMGKFSLAWQKEVEDFLNEGSCERKDAVNSLYNVRHSVAHGGNSTISVVLSRQYFDRVCEIVWKIADIFALR